MLTGQSNVIARLFIRLPIVISLKSGNDSIEIDVPISFLVTLIILIYFMKIVLRGVYPSVFSLHSISSVKPI
jgi:hypothetical protein